MSNASFDPRYRNRMFEGKDAASYLSHYTRGLSDALNGVDPETVNGVYKLLQEVVLRGSRLYVAGNGGSAAISDHLTCDWMKSTRAPGSEILRVTSLTANVPIATAIANDFGYQNIFAGQVGMYGQEGDCLVLISSSGNSPNILEAAKEGKKLGMHVVGFTGFDGGKLRDLADITVYVPSHNYGIVEDAHQAIMHALAQSLANWQDGRHGIKKDTVDSPPSDG